jgi:sialidase-1
MVRRMLSILLAAQCVTATGASDMGFTSLVAQSTEQYKRNSEGSIIELKDGTLLLAWSRFYGGAADQAAAHIAAMTSKDGGRTWSEPYVIQENTGRQNVMSVSFIRLKSGKIGMFYLEKNGPDDLHVYARYSDDEAKTWSAPERVTSEPGYHIMNNDRVVQLSTGRIICPICFTPDIGKPEPPLAIYCLYSDDEGKTWRKSTPDLHAPKRGAMEPGVAELANGDLLMIIRTQVGRIYTSTSKDKGSTWSEAVASDVVSPEAPATIKRVPGKKDLLLVWNNKFEEGKGHGGTRTPLTAAISNDKGKTWMHVKNIEDNPEGRFAYTSVVFVKERALLTYYEGTPDRPGLSLRLISVPLKWFYQ